MLARRATNQVYICARCRSKRPERSLNTVPFRGCESQSLQRRWQSAAAGLRPLRVAHRDDENDDDSSYAHQHSSPRQQAAERGSAPAKKHRYRKWRPKPTVELGVTSLGKPAEVLLLPSRDRVIPIVPEGGSNESPRATLQETIESQNVPLSGQSLTANIDQIRATVGKMRGQLEKNEWQSLRDRLYQGFKTEQLKSYLLAQSKAPKWKCHQQSKARSELNSTSSKTAIIKNIAEELWGFTLPTPPSSDERPVHRLPDQQEVKTLHGIEDAGLLRYLSIHGEAYWENTATLRKVTIRVTPEGYEISGRAKEVNRAQNAIRKYLKTLERVGVSLQASMTSFYADPKHQPLLLNYLQGLESKYKVVIVYRSESPGFLRIIGPPNSTAADDVRHEILLSGPDRPPHQPLALLTHWELNALHLQHQITSVPEIPQWMRDFSWQRAVGSSDSSRALSPTDYAPVLDDACRILQSESGIDWQQPHLYTYASFGQALVRFVAGDIDTANSAIPGKKAKAFNQAKAQASNSSMCDHFVVAGQHIGKHYALLPSSLLPHALDRSRQAIFANVMPPELEQQLQKLQPWTSQSSYTRARSPRDRRTVLLTFRPVAASSNFPTFEVHATATHVVGERSRYRIKLISAVHGTSHLIVRCPHQPLDVRFTQELRQLLLHPDVPGTTSDQALFNSIEAQVQRIDLDTVLDHLTDSSNRDFGHVVRLPVPEELRKVKRVQNPENMFRGMKVDTSQDQSLNHHELEYVLQPLEVVEVQSYRIAAKQSPQLSREEDARIDRESSGLCLDHITYLRDGLDRRTRQELRLSQNSYPGAKLLSPLHVPSFVTTALQVAKVVSTGQVLDDPSGRLKQETELPQEIISSLKREVRSRKKENTKKSTASPVATVEDQQQPEGTELSTVLPPRSEQAPGKASEKAQRKNSAASPAAALLPIAAQREITDTGAQKVPRSSPTSKSKKASTKVKPAKSKDKEVKEDTTGQGSPRHGQDTTTAVQPDLGQESPKVKAVDSIAEQVGKTLTIEQDSTPSTKGVPNVTKLLKAKRTKVKKPRSIPQLRVVLDELVATRKQETIFEPVAQAAAEKQGTMPSTKEVPDASPVPKAKRTKSKTSPSVAELRTVLKKLTTPKEGKSEASQPNSEFNIHAARVDQVRAAVHGATGTSRSH